MWATADQSTRYRLHPPPPPPLSLVEIMDSHRVLDVMIDNNLLWHSHINYLCKNISKKVYQLCRIKYFLDSHARRLFLHAHILSCISYCSTKFASENATKCLVRIYKYAIKAILLKSSSLTASDYEDLNILPLKLTFAKNNAIFMQKIAQGKVPFALQSKFQCCSCKHGKLPVPVPRLDLYKSSLRYSGSLLWNALPQTVKCGNIISVFKNCLTHHFKSIEWTQASCNDSMTLDYRCSFMRTCVQMRELYSWFCHYLFFM